jgi:hypothetical protein
MNTRSCRSSARFSGYATLSEPRPDHRTAAEVRADREQAGAFTPSEMGGGLEKVLGNHTDDKVYRPMGRLITAAMDEIKLKTTNQRARRNRAAPG